MMWKSVAASLMIAIGLAGTAFAQDATKDECVAKCKEAAQLVADEGLDAAISKINKANGSFVWKDSYVFLMDLDGTMLAHPIKPALIGKNVLDTPDKGPDKKLFFREFVKVAKSPGEGWVEYMWPKPGKEAPSKKRSYIYHVPGKDVLVGAGVYE
ncbi:MAG: cache domain-containing protein [Isosphaeraceae bacterium]